MDINWIDEQGVTQGTPVNRYRLMGMQGYITGEVVITKSSSGAITTITETSGEGVTTTRIRRNTGVINRQFVPSGNAGTITEGYTIVKSGDTVTITGTVSQ